MKNKTTATKAVKMYESIYGTVWSFKLPPARSDDTKTKNVYVLPADAASVERMVEQITRIWMDSRYITAKDLARAALASIGVKGGAK
jgi:hypothetical protein